MVLSNMAILKWKSTILGKICHIPHFKQGFSESYKFSIARTENQTHT